MTVNDRQTALETKGWASLLCEQCGQACGYDAARDVSGRVVHAHGCPTTKPMHVEPRRSIRGNTKRALFDAAFNQLLAEPGNWYRVIAAQEGDMCDLCLKPIVSPGNKFDVRNARSMPVGQFHIHHRTRSNA